MIYVSGGQIQETSDTPICNCFPYWLPWMPCILSVYSLVWLTPLLITGFLVGICVGYWAQSATALVRNYIMFIFVIDRFLSVFCPFGYPKYETKTSFSWSLANCFSYFGLCFGLLGISLHQMARYALFSLVAVLPVPY